MFVPSLSWQNDRLDINQLQKESFSAPTLLFQRILCGNVRRTLTVKGRVEKVDELVRHMAGTEHGPAKTKHFLLKSLLDACPEPVLVTRSFCMDGTRGKRRRRFPHQSIATISSTASTPVESSVGLW
jgi:hypothetical protein